MQTQEAVENIQRWLLAEGYQLQEKPGPDMLFRFDITDPEGLPITVMQPASKEDMVQIGVNWSPGDYEARFNNLPPERRGALLWNLRFSLLDLGVGFLGLDEPLGMINVSDYIYYDALTKDQLLHRVFHVRRALTLVNWMFNREFQEPPRRNGANALTRLIRERDGTGQQSDSRHESVTAHLHPSSHPHVITCERVLSRGGETR